MSDRWGNNGNSDRFNFLGLQNITVDGDYLFVGRKSMTNIEKDITLLTKVHIVKAMVFPVVL